MDGTVLLSHRLGLSGVTLQSSNPLPVPYPWLCGVHGLGDTAGPHWVGTWEARPCHPGGLLGGGVACLLHRRQCHGTHSLQPPCLCTDRRPSTPTPRPRPKLATLLHQRGGGTSQVLQQTCPPGPDFQGCRGGDRIPGRLTSLPTTPTLQA